MSFNSSSKRTPSSLNRSDSCIEIRTPAQERLRRLQGNLRDEIDSRSPPKTPSTLPATPKSPIKRQHLKRRSDHNQNDFETQPKKSKVNKSPSPSNNRRFSAPNRLRSLSLPFENDIEMTDATIQEEITSLRRNPTSRSDYSLSVEINAENKLVIKYKDFKDDEKTSALQRRLLSQQTIADTLHIIVDTNIFIKDLSVLPRLMKRKFPDPLGYPVLVVPYIVLKELENLSHTKRGTAIDLSAKAANRFINDQFSARNPQLKGQKAADHAHKLVQVQSGDDDVLNCGLQVKGSGKKVILLSNDVNLRNKALFNDIPAYSIQGIEAKGLTIDFDEL